MRNSKLILFALFIAVAKTSDHYEHHPNPRFAKNEPSPLAEKENSNFWMSKGSNELTKAKNRVLNEGIAKNIIIFVGDGMSIPTVTAARVLKGQFFSENKNRDIAIREGNSETIHWENFPNLGLSKTYSVNGMVPESASTATAIFSGVKTVSSTLGFDSHIILDDPNSVKDATPVTTILDWAQAAGKKTGFITNTRVTHATPAALYAKSASRHWECDSKMPEGHDLKDIARQMIENSPGKDTDLIFGGGLAPFVNYDLLEPEKKSSSMLTDFDYGKTYWNCHRRDSRNLMNEWVANNTQGKFIVNKTQLMDESLMDADKVRGIFSWSYMPYEDQMGEDSETPNLEEMTRIAVNYLSHKAGDEGFFLMVEGGRIDHSHHATTTVRSLRETIGLERAVKSATELVNEDDSLIIVTADHSHTFTIGGYPHRLADITQQDTEEEGKSTLAADKKPYTILSYGNGPGFMDNTVNQSKVVRPDTPSSLNYTYVQPSAIPLTQETHGGDDVGIWATGPLAHYFHSVHEQSYIAHVVSLAACIGPHKDDDRCLGSAGERSTINIYLVIAFSIIRSYF